MYCGGGHLGFPIDIKNINFVEMNVHWTVFYNLKLFCSDMKFKMAATAGLSLTLDEYFPIGSKVNLCPAVAAILDLRSA
jgi:hypothetical protein